MIKHFLKTLIIPISGIYLLFFPALAQAATIALSPSGGQANKGCTFSVNIELDTTGTATDGTDVILFYEPTKLSATVTSIENGKIYSDYPGNSVDSAGGKISISGISSVSSPFNGKGTFAKVKFQVLDTGTANSTSLKFDFDPNDKTKTTDTNVVERGTIADVLTQVTDGDYSIGTGNCASQAQASQGLVSPPPVSKLPVGGPIGSGSDSGTFKPTSLPPSGLLDSTIGIAALGGVLVILGIIGLALL